MQKQIILLFVLMLVFSNTSVSQTNSNPFIVVLDAGHGGKDPGRPTDFGYKEKDIALDIVLKIGNNLEKIEDIKVIYTRDKDVFIELRQRAKIANKADADLFVSVHCNAHNSQAYGTETYVLGLHRNDSNFRVAKLENEVIFLEDNFETNYEGFDPESPESLIGLTLMQEDYLDQSILLARYVQDNFTYKLKRKNRGVKQAGFWVLHNTYMPSILIETGFITNKSEGDYLNSQKGKISISKSISDAILNYKSKLNSDPLLETKALPNKLVEETEQKNKNISVAEIQPNSSKLIFKVQISAGPNRLSTKSYNFNGLSQISRQKLDSIYRYFYGNTSKYSIALELLKKAISKGYKTAYIVAYSDGEMITINEALKSATN
ncbi:N-acetylmuramoyl-L-alanine amidase [Flavobacteriaceae bacterium]|jgi:N-acetylmuramoyl-L-alanine amidase|nr:N-acetylmuramoyl-L-alanine amidase [Flavobacteriaceae bacterium]MDC0463682.1 N-acetylmuramoyl-L-alanine amidase [Flavobacteriaceae bacterium]